MDKMIQAHYKELCQEMLKELQWVNYLDHIELAHNCADKHGLFVIIAGKKYPAGYIYDAALSAWDEYHANSEVAEAEELISFVAVDSVISPDEAMELINRIKSAQKGYNENN